MVKLVVTLSLLLMSAGLASGQAIQVGDYELDWAILHTPVSSDLPTLTADTWQIKLENAPGTGLCPPTSAYVVRDAPGSPISGGTTWCIKSDGAFDSSANPPQLGSWQQYTDTHAIIHAKQGSRGSDEVMAVARLQTAPPPPPPSPIKVFITNPKAGTTVSGTVWVVIWAEGTSGSGNRFILKVNGTSVGSQNAGSSRGPVTIPWNTQSGPNGAYAIKAEVIDDTRNTGTSAAVSVIVNNP